MSRPKLSSLPFFASLFVAATAAGCSSSEDGSGTATLEVLLETEDLVTDGLDAGDELENIADGWNVDFEKYIVSIGEVTLRLSTDSEIEKEQHGALAVDLTTLRSGGEQMWTFEDIADGNWDVFYNVQPEEMEKHESVSQEDFDAMKENNWTYLIHGELSADDGLSCPPKDLATPGDAESTSENDAGDPCYAAPSIKFEVAAEAETVFGPCEIDGVAGVATTSDTTSTVALTIHGDHLFFNGFPEGDEGGITRLAQWMADCDLDLDGTVTMEEFAKITPDDLAAFDDRFSTGGSPITPLDNMATYLQAQLMTQGHFQGEGECAMNGEFHDHGHDHDHDHDH